MKHIQVPFVREISYKDTIYTVSQHLDNLPRQILECVPWPTYPYKPHVEFSMAHSNSCIFLKFFITEKTIRAATAKINGAVWKDTCVEFFIAFDGEKYYNLEFNCIGTISAAFGADREGRKQINDELLRKIKYGITIDNQTDGNIHWEITSCIPVQVFTHYEIQTLNRRQFKANFYKCGDELDEPHFISWTSMESPEPDFHLPVFFGLLSFE